MKMINFLKKEPVLVISGLLAIISMLFVPVDYKYVSYINYDVIIILFCLMAVVEGIRRAGAFSALSAALFKNVSTDRKTVLILSLLCFFSSAFITNDIALITFVPFSLSVMKNAPKKTIIWMVVAQTVAANLGSLITPIGNPQNLHLYTYYNISLGEFFCTMLPLGCICLLLVLILCMFVPNTPTMIQNQKDEKTDKKSMMFYGVLFLLCILSVLGVVSYEAALVIVCVSCAFKDIKIFLKVDYILLITFVFFFVFVGNISRMDYIYYKISGFVKGRELVVSALISQAVSNVPAATMLSGFTSDYKALLLGTNIGGLGTIIASMASLISFRQISAFDGIKKGKYFAVFTLVNVILLAILLFIYTVIL